MKSVLSYAAEIRPLDFQIRDTVAIYREAVSFLIDIAEQEWESLSVLDGSKARLSAMELLIHSANGRKVKYPEFDSTFYKFPSYLRRGAINAAIGSVSNYHSNYQRWLDKGKNGNPPKLTLERDLCPCFYRDNMYVGDISSDEACIKVFVHNDWVWRPIRLKHTDMQFLRRYWTGVSCSAPVLERKNGKWFLRFTFTQKVKLSETPIEGQRILSVDLGLNTDAVGAIMESDGTILGRKFIDFPGDKDRQYHELNRLKKFQRMHGSHNSKSRWRRIRSLNEELARKIGHAIADYAAGACCDAIVFEYLDMKGKIRGKSKRQKLHLWRKNGIQHVAETRAHRFGLHVYHVNARNTSRLAYDGSGYLARDKNNHALSVFKNGKQYNCDLSASYNIGARYFVRELLKPLPETARSQIRANVPGTEHRTSCTYHTLLQTAEELCRLSVSA